MQPFITVPKLDWIPTELYFTLPIFIFILAFVLKTYKRYLDNQREKSKIRKLKMNYTKALLQ